MHRTRDFDRVVVDASPFFRFGSAGYLINLVSYVGPKLAIARSVENELERNANDQRFAFLRALQLVQPPIDVIDLTSGRLEAARDQARAKQKPGDHPNTHLGETQTAYLADQLGGDVVIVIGEDDLLKKLAKNKLGLARLSTAQLAAEMVVAGALSRVEGEVVYVSAGGDAQHFFNTLKQATEAAPRP